MRAVGLHFGHDAGVASVNQDGLERFISKERRVRTKHAIGLSLDDIAPFLEAGTPVGLSSTQNIPMFVQPGVQTVIDGSANWRIADWLAFEHHAHWMDPTSWIPDPDKWSGSLIRDGTFYFDDRHLRCASYDAIGMVSAAHPNQIKRTRRSARLQIADKTSEGWFYEHHFLHALYAAHATSAERPALVVTYDGALGPAGGGIYHWSPGQRLTFISSADAWVGAFYNEVATRVGLGRVAGAGKLMGLAPYGRPIYFKCDLVGTYSQVSGGYSRSIPEIVDAWLEGLSVPVWDRFAAEPPAIVANIASSAQLIVELNIRDLVAASIQSAAHMGFQFDCIVLSGGVALNCPSNSNLSQLHERPIKIPPGLNDEGLAIGAALAAYFDTYGHYPSAPNSFAEAVYIGTDLTRTAVEAAATRYGWQRAGGIEEACSLVIGGGPLGLAVGKSELGPRALGHRSIIVSPTLASTWPETNRLKGREPWRPFAPAVLSEAAEGYFDRGPPESRFMLFNYRCRTKDLPAITHVDNSARAQHVSAETGLLYDMLCRLRAAGHPPVVLNTSFNGPGVPIVDSAEDVFEEAGKIGLRNVLTEFGLFHHEYEGQASGAVVGSWSAPRESS